MSTRTLTVVSGGLRQPSSTRLLADRLAAATESAFRRPSSGITGDPGGSAAGVNGSAAGAGEDVKVDVVELRDHAHDLTNHLLTGFPSPELRETIDTLAASDGLIVVTPIFAASYSGLFKTFFDVLEPDALAGKPVLIAATGGTERHSLALEHVVRPLFTYLHAVVVPTSVYAATADWGSADDQAQALTDRIDRAAGELAALIAATMPAQRPDPYAEPVPFEKLLDGSAGPLHA
ncbi:MAG: FMN reductase [Micromonosporaceae bacterium]